MPDKLADLIAFQPIGPCILFVRPQHPMTLNQYEGLSKAASALTEDMPNVVVSVLMHGVVVFAVGEAEMTRLGWMKIPT